MKRSSSLQIALYRDASKSAAEWAREKLAQLEAEERAARAPKPAPRYGYFVLAALLSIGVIAAVYGLTH